MRDSHVRHGPILVYAIKGVLIRGLTNPHESPILIIETQTRNYLMSPRKQRERNEILSAVAIAVGALLVSALLVAGALV